MRLSLLVLLFAWIACAHDNSTSTDGDQAPVECGDVACGEGEFCVYTPAHCVPCSPRDASRDSGDSEGECEDEQFDETYVCESVPDDCLNQDSKQPELCLGPKYCRGYLWYMFSDGVLDCGAPPHTCY